MKGFLKTAVIAAAFTAAVVSCTDKARVIPVKKMERIYAEMLLADQWLNENPDKRGAADTSWFYKPVFEKYGFTSEDYLKSVDYYLNDPMRYAELMGRVVKDLKDNADRLGKSIQMQYSLRQKADSIALAMKSLESTEMSLYEHVFLVPSMTDRIRIVKNGRGVYFPEPVAEDTVFKGPEMIVRDSIAVQPDTVAAGPDGDEEAARPAPGPGSHAARGITDVLREERKLN